MSTCCSSASRSCKLYEILCRAGRRNDTSVASISAGLITTRPLVGDSNPALASGRSGRDETRPGPTAAAPARARGIRQAGENPDDGKETRGRRAPAAAVSDAPAAGDTRV